MKTRETILSGDYKYTFINSMCSSERLGNCEVCGKFVSNMFHQIEEKKFVGGYTHYRCSDYFGHESCLKSKQRGI